MQPQRYTASSASAVRGGAPRSSTTKATSASGPSPPSRAIRFDDLHSPGSDSPPRVSGGAMHIARGSFSDHIASPSPHRQAMTSNASAHGAEFRGGALLPRPPPSQTKSVLRSPTRKRAPTPALPPKTPLSASTAGSILMPSRAPQRTSKTPPRSVGLTPAHTPAAAASADIVGVSSEHDASACTTSVNPVDALAKKLRQQAAELTKVYEQMEKKDEDLDRLHAELGEVKMQATRRLSTLPKPLLPPTSVSRGAARSTAKPGAARRGSAFGSSQPSVTKRRAIPASSSEASTTQANAATREEYHAAMSRMEEALVELAAFHDELRRYLPALEASDNDQTRGAVAVEDIQHEQQLYIRVLEEAVHLKASELQITGHEELLVVLAELRHTIYQQEQDIGELRQELDSARGELVQHKTARLEIEDARSRERAQWEDERQAWKQRETSSQRQLEEVQRLVHSEHVRFRQERSTLEAQTTQLSTLQDEVHAKTTELQRWEARNAEWAKHEAAMKQQVAVVHAQLQSERQACERAKEECEVTQRQVDELKALQEGFLHSIDAFVDKEDTFERRLQEMERDLERSALVQQENDSLRTSIEALQSQLASAKQESEELVTQRGHWKTLQDWMSSADASLQPFCTTTIEDALHTTTSWSPVGHHLSVLVERCASLRQSMQDIASALPWLPGLLDHVHSTASLVRSCVDTWGQEQTDLQASCRTLTEAASTSESELRRLQSTLIATESRLAEAEMELAESKLRISTMDEEVKHAAAEKQLQEALAEQIFELERLHKAQQERLHAVLLQNKDLMTLETELAIQIEAKEDEILRLQTQLFAFRDQEGTLRELERELEVAATLAEDQNAWNQQLSVELESLELEKAEQEQLIETLQTREEAFGTRFTTLFTQYMQFVATNKQRLVREQGGEYPDKEPVRSSKYGSIVPTIYDEAVSSADVLQMLRVFPTLVEEYLAGAMLGIESQTRESDAAARRMRGQRQRRRELLLAVQPLLPPQKQIVDRQEATSGVTKQVDAPEFGTQLQLISDAFKRFKSV